MTNSQTAIGPIKEIITLLHQPEMKQNKGLWNVQHTMMLFSSSDMSALVCDLSPEAIWKL